MMRAMPSKFYFGTNTKRDLDRQSHIDIVKSAIALSEVHPDVQFFVLPPDPLFGELKALAAGSNVWIGSQNVTYTTGPNVTGEVSARLLSEIGSDLVMAGHAERRALGEDGPIVGIQLRKLSDVKVNTLLCIGELEKTDDMKERLQAFRSQMEPLGAIPRNQLIIAYEPVWSIGQNGEAADPVYVEESIKQIRSILIGLNRSGTPILYGGSVQEENAAFYSVICDGLFVGRAACAENGFKAVFEAGFNSRNKN